MALGAGLPPGARERGFWPLPVLCSAVHPAAVIILHTMPGTDQVESMSPFCMKVEDLELQKVIAYAFLANERIAALLAA